MRYSEMINARHINHLIVGLRNVCDRKRQVFNDTILCVYRYTGAGVL